MKGGKVRCTFPSFIWFLLIISIVLYGRSGVFFLVISNSPLRIFWGIFFEDRYT